MKTTIEKATKVLFKYLSECDTDDFCAVFDHAFGTMSTWDPETENFEIEACLESAYGGILEDEEAWK